MTYNGIGTRFSTTALGATTQYVSDGQLPLVITSEGTSTTVLYGLGKPIAEKTDKWNYVLHDGVNIPRQLTESHGLITLGMRYDPWGKPVETYGISNFDASYIATLIDVSTGLIYIGDGQYYDPETGRFLTRGVNPNSNNPYVPWNPIGLIYGPLGLLSIYYSRKKGKRSPLTIMIFLALIISACSICPKGDDTSTNNQPEASPTGTATEGPATVATSTPTPTGTPTPTPTVTPCPYCASWSGGLGFYDRAAAVEFAKNNAVAYL